MTDHLTSDKSCCFCSTAQSKYSCSRCHRRYCSAECYRSPDHNQCSEEFFKECVTQELLSQQFDESSKRKFLEILQRHDKQFLEDLIGGDDTEDGDGGDNEQENEESFDSRFNDLDINDSTDVWNQLSDCERKQFNELLKNGQIGQFVELWTPWWTTGADQPLVTPLDGQTNGKHEHNSRLPPLSTDITQLKDLISKPVSPSVCPSVVNVLVSYCYVCRLFNGDYNSIDAIQTLINKCPQLSHNIVCNEIDKSLDMAVQQIVVEQPSQFAIESLRDVKTLINGPKIRMTSFESPEYVLRALSDLIAVSHRNKRNVSKQRRKELNLELVTKKLEFFLSWSVTNGKSLVECVDNINVTINTLLLSEESSGSAKVGEDLRTKLKPKTLIEEIN